MAIDQLTAACLAASCAFRALPRNGRRDHGLTPGQATALNAASSGHLQLLVDELHRTEPRPERTYELRTTGSSGLGGISHCVLLCTDRRVVYAETNSQRGITVCVVFPHGVLDVQNKLVKVKPELSPGLPPVLIWPRIGGDDDEIDIGVRQVMGEPSPHLRELLERVRTGGRTEIDLVAPYPPAVAPPGWHPDPRGRHELRWWDGARWTSNVADAGVTATDPV
jgi:Protein of unknown function (DUF2510)